MTLLRLQVRNFRNLAAVELAPAPGLTVVTGDNGAGKTNLVEAIALLHLGQSFRARRPEELVGRGGSEALVRGEIGAAHGGASVAAGTGGSSAATGPAGTETLVCQVRADGKKILLRQGKPAAQGELLRAWTVVLFGPDDLLLARGAPLYRRRFLDVWLARLQPAYYPALLRYGQALAQRNRLLQRLRGTAGSDELASWDRELVRWGSELLAARGAALAAYGPALERRYRELHGAAALTIRYRSALPALPEREAVAAQFAEKLRGLRGAELARGVTLLGPHRDDLEFLIDGFPVRAGSSSGEQRLLALALRLLEHETLAAARTPAPVLVLDDVFSELDARHRELVVAAAAAAPQCFLTATAVPAELRGRGEVVTVQRGELTSGA